MEHDKLGYMFMNMELGAHSQTIPNAQMELGNGPQLKGTNSQLHKA